MSHYPEQQELPTYPRHIEGIRSARLTPAQNTLKVIQLAVVLGFLLVLTFAGLFVVGEMLP